MEAKADIKREGIRARNSIPREERDALAERIRRHALTCPELGKAKLILSYAASGGEPDMRPLEAFLPGASFCYPVCTDGEIMEAYIPGPEGWTAGLYGISAPDPLKSVLIDPVSIDAVLIPCTAFDGRGYRTGMGKGYYDRFLLRCPAAFRLLIAYACQRVGKIPEEATDIPAMAAATEEGFFRF